MRPLLLTAALLLAASTLHAQDNSKSRPAPRPEPHPAPAKPAPSRPSPPSNNHITGPYRPEPTNSPRQPIQTPSPNHAGAHQPDTFDARRNLNIHNNLAGGRTLITDRPGNVRLVVRPGRPGYISRPYNFHNHNYLVHTYYLHGQPYNRFYRTWGFHGISLEIYAPARYYPFSFYTWAYRPWGPPIRYGWNWRNAAWFTFYTPYWTPYPTYAAASFWLTDYLIAQSLQDQYAAYQAAYPDQPAPPPLDGYSPMTPEIKQQVDAEVQRQLALDASLAQQNAAGQEPDPAATSIAASLADGQQHIFIAGDEVDTTDASGRDCALTAGDALQLTSPPAPNDTTAQLVVLSSKGGPDCRRSAIVQVGLDDLQAMQNHMRETLDQGLQELQTTQGQNGLPAAPPATLAPPTPTALAQSAPPPDPTAAADLAAQADPSQQPVLAPSPGPAPYPEASLPAATQEPAPIISIRLGQSPDEVQSQLGAPTQVVNLGSKSIYIYKDMKVTFLNNRVTDIE